MVFSSPVFLFGFLPLALFLYYASPKALKNGILLFISLLFYSWGEVFYIFVMLASIVTNYIVGLMIDHSNNKTNPKLSPRSFLILGLLINIAILVFFKYTNFIVDNFNSLFYKSAPPFLTLDPIHLPLGISFFTFQAISYIVDVYRNEAAPQKNIFNLALYIALFPQLIAGPIIRYHDIYQQIINRTHSVLLFSSGTTKFIYGLAKKMLIANPLGLVADNVFSLPNEDLTMPLAWIGILAYTLQIFFDFSGYSDMAIGLGRMFGFRFLENFNYPYISTSLREFWKRWHISLSTWFRDYVYFSLGGNRVTTFRVYRNLFVVFCLTGIWHGSSWNFLIWGLFHGVFLAGEHAGFTNILSKTWRPIQHLYLLFIVIISWVFFRANTLPQAIDFLYSMINITNFQTSSFQYAQIITKESIYVFLIGIVLSTPLFTKVKQFSFVQNKSSVHLITKIALPSTLLILSILKVASSTYNPFIYFRF